MIWMSWSCSSCWDLFSDIDQRPVRYLLPSTDGRNSLLSLLLMYVFHYKNVCVLYCHCHSYDLGSPTFRHEKVKSHGNELKNDSPFWTNRQFPQANPSENVSNIRSVVLINSVSLYKHLRQTPSHFEGLWHKSAGGGMWHVPCCTQCRAEWPFCKAFEWERESGHLARERGRRE